MDASLWGVVADAAIGVNIGDKSGHDVGAKASQLRLI